MFDFDALSHAMTRQTVLCVGDLMHAEDELQRARDALPNLIPSMAGE